MSDPRITPEAVLAAIYSRANRRRVIWSPSTTLSAMGIERYPHLPQGKYRSMKKVLQELCDAGLLVRRPHLHSRYTMKEVAYDRIGENHAGVGVWPNQALQQVAPGAEASEGRCC